MRRLDLLIAQCADGVGPLIVGEEKDDVGPGLGISGVCLLGQGSDCQPKR
jgi:hypothetical protein